VLAAWALLYALADAQSWSSFRLYWLRLRSTFATTQNRAHRARHAPGHAGVYPLSVAHEPAWADYAGRPGPRLVVCAAARGPRGRARSFTFSDDAVALRDAAFEAVVRPADYARCLPARHLGSVSASAALSGAAFTPAAGRLLAALNVRLGAWMPNPRYAVPARRLKKPSVGYLLKELFGVYDPDDPYVYVAGGGHWEDLGLVELLRRRARWIFCVDATEAGTAFDRAVVLARIECGAEIELDTRDLRGEAGARLPKSAVKTGVIRYHDCGGVGADDCPTGLLFYGRATLAQDSPMNALSYSLRDGAHPRRPAYDGFLAEDEFNNLVRLGEWVGRGLALDYERYGPPP
jgi:hypothetical protein